MESFGHKEQKDNDKNGVALKVAAPLEPSINALEVMRLLNLN